jgi:hypothetical protein
VVDVAEPPLPEVEPAPEIPTDRFPTPDDVRRAR